MRESGWIQRLLHRWFVEYNPLYLLSAACVLVGVNLISSGLSGDSSLLGAFGAAAIAELYSWALIAGAALLVRIGQRRPAVLLALIAAVYQCDVTMHTETCAYLGLAGAIASLAWLVSFVAKLEALGWALRIRPNRAALALATLGAASLVLMPRVLRALSPDADAAVLAASLFGLFSFAGWLRCRVWSSVPLDGWGKVVLRRTVFTIWTLWGVLLLCHANFWAVEHGVPRGVMVPVALLLAARFMRSERAVFALVTAALALCWAAMPGFVWLTALLAAGVLVSWALKKPVIVSEAADPIERPPYRSAPEKAPERAAPELRFVRASGPERTRVLAAALLSAHFGLWTIGWSGGALPPHVLALDLTLTLALLLLLRRAIAIVPLCGHGLHFAVQLGWVSAPEGMLEWGLSVAGAGFVLLVLGLGASYRLRSLPP